MEDTGMIPVFFNAKIELAKKIVESAYHGGARVFEFTNRGANAFEVFGELLPFVQSLPGAALGIGTILNGRDARKYIDAGAQFIVSPIFKKEMAEVCLSQDTIWIPGCATLTEMVSARDAGAAVVKLFPASVLGPKFVSAIKQVVPDLKVMPTGGVDTSEKNLREWFNAGVMCVGMGSQLLEPELISTRDWPKLAARVSNVLDLIGQIKSSFVKS